MRLERLLECPIVRDMIQTHYGLQGYSLEEIKKLCWEQLEAISEKNLTQILAGKTESQFGKFFTSKNEKGANLVT